MVRWQQNSWMLLQNFFKGDKNSLTTGFSFIGHVFPLGYWSSEGTVSHDGSNQSHMGSLPCLSRDWSFSLCRSHAGDSPSLQLSRACCCSLTPLSQAPACKLTPWVSLGPASSPSTSLVLCELGWTPQPSGCAQSIQH